MVVIQKHGTQTTSPLNFLLLFPRKVILCLHLSHHPVKQVSRSSVSIPAAADDEKKNERKKKKKRNLSGSFSFPARSSLPLFPPLPFLPDGGLAQPHHQQGLFPF